VKGFSLVEVLVAMALLAVAGLGLVELLNISGIAARDSRVDAIATMAAESKIAELRADPATFFGGSLNANSGGYSDFITADGALAGTGSPSPRSAVYLRRWAVSPAPLDPNTLVLQVVATRVGQPSAREVHLISLFSRAVSR
jgi:prepilin-type N-terminal cleavage/methylation domain-containing protein